ncbi:energy-coupling factor ABC transporter substrate-binding protein [Cylindrospermum sp. FACHB-282]|uniref:energy-coupling factor ABC transporter substrate-binding protein n=1 Tax=Cylindrospermum sp. FACHB-282 TaxID=2692794 RepID=UPI001686C8C2|nr:energy-coupling factor ABC transporter substrate-binding protein [Cylindrospermum sp. FACHB-282]MBD2385625.1 energy-coupling factor ABC transporter substrate-binding protein [Cylindrospermum sp. FACHB-282]
MNQSKKGLSNWFLIAGVVFLAVVPLIVARNAEFLGADDRATIAVTEVNPGYQPWFKPLMQVPSCEVQTFLFAAQAALGAGALGYFIGLSKGRTEQRKNHEHSD